jgi:Reverse transcriptase (RNA-dependent DNA polymerase)
MELIRLFLVEDIKNLYLSRVSNTHLSFIYVSKAFDRVRYDTLYIKLSKFISGVTLCLLIVWYAGQIAGILWAVIVSDVLPLNNVVRQPSVQSPLLFNVYINKL